MNDSGTGPVGPASAPETSPVGAPAAAPAPSAWATQQQTTPYHSAPAGQPFSAPDAGTPTTDAWPNTPYGSAAFQQGPSATAPFAGGPAAATPAPRRAGRLRIGLAGLVAGALIGGGAGAGVATLVDEPAASSGRAAAAQNVVIQNPETATTATAAAAKAAPSVVTVYVSSTSGSGSGSGVVLTADGFVLTNNHVVAEGGGAESVEVRTADGTLYDASVVGTDPASDLAVLRLDGADGLTPAEFADSDDVQVGDVAVAIGAPLGLSNTVTTGIISATERAVQTGSSADDATVLDAIQTDAAINPGNSGGALVNGAGEVIGINTAIATVASGTTGSQSQSGNIGVGFAIPGNTAKRIGQEIIETGSATRAFLGVSARTEADGQNGEIGAGARIERVESGSAAEDAGLQVGDVVTAVDDRPVTTSTELTAAVRSQAPGEQVTLTVRRGGESRTVEITLGSTS